jgi:hypothetical protein
VAEAETPFSDEAGAEQCLEPPVHHVANLSVLGGEGHQGAIVFAEFVPIRHLFQGRHESSVAEDLFRAFKAFSAVKTLDARRVSSNPSGGDSVEVALQIIGAESPDFVDQRRGELIVCLWKQSVGFPRQLVDMARPPRTRPQPDPANHAIRLQPGEVALHRGAAEAQGGAQAFHRVAALQPK